MKNLKLLCRDEFAIPENSSCFAFDTETLRVYFSRKRKVSGFENGVAVFSVDLSSPDSPLGGDVIGLEFLCGEERLCAATRNGDILLVDVVSSQVEFVGALDCDVIMMRWSPDQEIVLLVCSRGNVVVMDREFQPITELEICAESFGEGGFVDVGWGRKETQFQGSAGKFKGDKGVTQGDIRGDTPSKGDTQGDGGVSVVWRGDGQYFAVSSFEDKRRKIRVWSRDFALQFTSEEIAGLERTLAWQPSGSLLAATQRKAHRYDVVFFELNGLQHGEFPLPGGEVRMLQWSSDSKVLLVVSESEDKSSVHLWTCSNYHWSLKHELCFEERHLVVGWDSEDANSLHVLQRSGLFRSFLFSGCVDSSERSSVAVIDANKLKMTPFDHLVVPPPMCAYDLEFEGQIKCVAFPGFPTEREQVCVLLNSGELFMLSAGAEGVPPGGGVKVTLGAAGGTGFKVKTEILKFKCSWKLEGFDLQTVRSLTWFEQNRIVVVDSLPEKDRVSLLGLGRQLELMNSVEIEDKVVGVCMKGDSAVVQLRDGGFVETDFESVRDYFDSSGDTVKLPSVAQQMAVCDFDNTPLLLTLSRQRRLRLGNTVLCQQCSSFAVHDRFLVATTTNHKLLFFPRDCDITKSSNLAVDLSRSLERGSTIVTATPSGTKVVLQMPRGNLEVVHPRPLVLSVVKRALDGSEFKAAFSLMRKHRVNLNLIHDHDPAKFAAGVATFVRQLDSATFINIFLCDLIEEDVTVTMYGKFYPERAEVKRSLFSAERSKVDAVCSLLLGQLLREDRAFFLLSIVTAHVRKTRPEIGEALKVAGSSEDGLKHLHVLVDSRVLRDEALATYDLELALKVSQASHDDPKEYLPFLAELKRFPERYRRYRIDAHLKRFGRALANIAQCPDHWGECLSLVREQGLYREALSVFEAGSPRYREVGNLYAEHLAGNRLYEEAGVVFYRCGLHKRALKCFTAAGSHNLALVCARALEFDRAEVTTLARTLAADLASKGRTEEAGWLLEREAGDYSGAVTLLVKGHHWEQAFRIIRGRDLPDLIDSCLLPAMEGRKLELASCIGGYASKFEKFFSRLVVVRENKAQRAQKLAEGDDLDSDVASDFGSTYTGGSSSSASTSKSRRKRERKRFSLKEGSRYEEEGLLRELGGVYAALHSVKSPVHELVMSLALFHRDGSELQLLFKSTEQIFAKYLDSIWMIPSSDDVIGGDVIGSTVNNIVSSFNARGREFTNLSDLEIYIPPKIENKAQFGMYLYEK